MTEKEQVNALWHAFNALDDHQKDTVQKSQLKVFISNLGNVLGVKNFEDKFEAHFQNDTTFVAFTEFTKVIEDELMEAARAVSAHPDFRKMDEVAWLLVERQYLDRPDKVLTVDSAFLLWQMFNRLADDDEYPLRMDQEEVAILAEKIIRELGKNWDTEEFDNVVASVASFSYRQVLSFLESRYLKNMDPEFVAEAIREIHDLTVKDVVKKGFLEKRGQVIKNWHNRWFVLGMDRLCYYSTKTTSQVHMKGQMLINEESIIQSQPKNRFTFFSSGRSMEMSAIDTRAKTEWVTAIEDVMKMYGMVRSPVIMEKLKRQERRLRKKAQQLDVERKMMASSALIEEQNKQLELERQARALAEQQVAQEAALKEAEQRRNEELQELQRQLEALLEQERLARQSEADLKSAHERLLEEEKGRREKLEELQENQRKELEDERKLRENLEGLKKDQDAVLAQERLKLEQLELERLKTEEAFKAAQEKLADAEEQKRQLEEAKERARNRFVVGLARPMGVTVKVSTHRGLGAFSDVDLCKVPMLDETAPDLVEKLKKRHAKAGDLDDTTDQSSEQ